MPDGYVIESILPNSVELGDAAPTDSKALAWPFTLGQEPSEGHPSYLLIQTEGMIRSRDNPVMIAQMPSRAGLAAWTVIGHLVTGMVTHLIEISAPTTLPQNGMVDIQAHAVSGGRFGDTGLQAGALDDFEVTTIQVLYRPK